VKIERTKEESGGSRTKEDGGGEERGRKGHKEAKKAQRFAYIKKKL